MHKQLSAIFLSCFMLGCQTSESVLPSTQGPQSAEMDVQRLKRLLPRHLSKQDYCADYDRFVSASLTSQARIYLDAQRAVCNLPTTDVTRAQAEEKLAGRDIAFTSQGDVLTLFQRGPMDDPKIARMMGKLPGPEMCCPLQTGLWRRFSGSDLWVARYRLRDLQAGMLFQLTSRSEERTATNSIEWRGPLAPAPISEPIPVAGKIEEFYLPSPQLNEVRRFSVYTPANIASLSNLPVIIMADGGGYASLVDSLIQTGKIRPVIIIGVASGNDGIVGPPRPFPSYVTRSQDYSPSFENSTFTRHLDFIINVIRPWVAARYPISRSRDDWVVSGQSQGGEFAVNVGLIRPDIFGHAWPMSIAGGTVNLSPLRTNQLQAQFKISAGHYEPAFMQNSREAVDGLQAAGADAKGRWFSAGHARDQWEVALADNLIATFPAAKK